MTENKDYGFWEAPASMTAKVIDGAGFEWLVTLRDRDENALLKRAAAMRETLLKAGAHPAGNGHSLATQGQSNGTGTQPPAPMCPSHNVPMRRGKMGGWYCPSKIAEDDGTGKPVYCKQKVKE